jgi:hypothetical protein
MEIDTMKQALMLVAVILFTALPAAANPAPTWQEVKNDAREAKHGIKSTAKQVKYDIKHGVKNSFREVKHGVKQAFR